jgi:chloride channel 7
MVLAIAAAALCAYVAPAAAGSGIPEVKAYLNGVDAPSILAPPTLFVKVSLLVN